MALDQYELRCPDCGGEVEQRGTVRFYSTGVAVEKIDGHREWVESRWITPVETLTLDEIPFHCLDCDVQWHLEDLTAQRVLSPSPVSGWPARPEVHREPFPARSGPYVPPEDL